MKLPALELRHQHTTVLPSKRQGAALCSDSGLAVIDGHFQPLQSSPLRSDRTAVSGKKLNEEAAQACPLAVRNISLPMLLSTTASALMRSKEFHLITWAAYDCFQVVALASALLKGSCPACCYQTPRTQPLSGARKICEHGCGRHQRKHPADRPGGRALRHPAEDAGARTPQHSASLRWWLGARQAAAEGVP